MRFRRYGHFAFNDTKRKRAAAVRKQQRERDACPLFADQIAALQPSIPAVMENRRQRWEKSEQEDRHRRAAKWRQARKALSAFPDQIRAVLLGYWTRCKWPGDPEYLLAMLNMYRNGRLNLQSTW